jgi:hypothetical protein
MSKCYSRIGSCFVTRTFFHFFIFIAAAPFYLTNFFIGKDKANSRKFTSTTVPKAKLSKLELQHQVCAHGPEILVYRNVLVGIL